MPESHQSDCFWHFEKIVRLPVLYRKNVQWSINETALISDYFFYVIKGRSILHGNDKVTTVPFVIFYPYIFVMYFYIDLSCAFHIMKTMHLVSASSIIAFFVNNF